MTKPTVAVITPTIGKNTFPKAWQSVYDQDHYMCKHYLFVDGAEYESKFTKSEYVGFAHTRNTRLNLIRENVGKALGQSFYGHRIYAAAAHLVNEDYVLFLDEDNWYDKDHVTTLVDLMESHSLDFAFSLRQIYDKDGNFICNDECESLGFFPIYGQAMNGYHVDTSSYCFRRTFLMQVSHLWHFGWGADRRFFNTMRMGVQPAPRYGCTGFPTLCYRLEGNENSVTKEFFERGNKEMIARYLQFDASLPCRSPQLM